MLLKLLLVYRTLYAGFLLGTARERTGVNFNRIGAASGPANERA